MELVGIHPDIMAQIYKMASVSLCPNVIGQITVGHSSNVTYEFMIEFDSFSFSSPFNKLGLMVSPPVEGDESYELYVKERDTIYNSLKERAVALIDALNKLPGVSCNPAEGAMYAFPKLTIPDKAVEEAKKAGLPPDSFYAISLLDETGICIVPGSGFGQRDGTWHFRTTFLPSKEKIPVVIDRLSKFHNYFMKRYSS